MTEKRQNGMQCSQFEALLPDALDGILTGEISRAFQAHADVCPACGPIFAEARQGMLWLQALEEVQPPSNLVHNILAATSAAEATEATGRPAASRPGWAARVWKPIRGVLAGAMQPRFATSFSMAFFSLSLTLTLAGVKFKDLAHIDWRPSAMGKAVVLQYTQVESKVVRYYNNMRLVYEIQSRVGELRKNSGAEQKNEGPTQDQPKQDKKKKQNNDTSGRPELRQDNYSQEADNAVIAYLTQDDEGANR
jgi:hypothetical protein